MKKLLIPIVIIVALGIGAVGMYLILGGEKDETPWEPVSQTVERPGGDKFTCNLQGSMSHYVVANIALFVTATEKEPNTIDTVMADLTASLDAQDGVMRDTIITVLRSVTLEEAIADDAQRKIEDKIRKALNEKLNGIDDSFDNNITRVLFRDFLVS
jgi:flagellar basal body-associated protein FliL